MSVIEISAGFTLGKFPRFREHHQEQKIYREEYGRGERIRTSEWRDQNPLPYHLATPL
jgi:hypothetical protein